MPELRVDTASFELRGVGQTRAGRTVLQDVDVTIPRAYDYGFVWSIRRREDLFSQASQPAR